MRKAQPLPDQFAAAPFTVSAARSSGISLRRLRSGDLDARVWGTRRNGEVTALAELCELIQLRSPERVFFSHSTAAVLHSIPLPWKLEAASSVHLSVPSPSRPISARGIEGHRLALSAGELCLRNGLRMTSPARTWTDLAEQLALHELVAAGDHLIRWRSPVCTPAELGAAVGARINRRGLALLASALPLLNDRAESPPESHLRLLLMAAGLPTPRINHVVTDRFGEFVARTDFAFDEEKVVLEYQGDYHRTNKKQWRADMTRRAKIEAIDGWRVMEINADDLHDPAELTARIRALFARHR